MFVHLVLFRPKPDVSAADRQAMFDALAAAAAIPSVKRFHIGTRVTHDAAYERLMRDDYPYTAVIEFDDLVGLQAYLEHPAHKQLGELFYRFLDGGLVYDYEMRGV